MSKMLENMREEMDDVQARLVTAREKANSANEVVAALAREERALQAALDVLTGNEPKTPVVADPARQTILDALARLAPGIAESAAVAATPSEPGGKGPLRLMPKSDIVFNAPEGWTKGILNGEEILLEPGMAVMKNSFGEEVIAKVGTVFAPMTEPVVPEAHAEILPPIADHEEFDSVEEMLDG